MHKYPLQPVVVVDGVARFRENPIVSYLLHHSTLDMNDLARMPFADDEREQFAQLIGYSVDGFADLSYASNATVAGAQLSAAYALGCGCTMASGKPGRHHHPDCELFTPTPEEEQAVTERIFGTDEERLNRGQR